jgi:hypothetical protein
MVPSTRRHQPPSRRHGSGPINPARREPVVRCPPSRRNMAPRGQPPEQRPRGSRARPQVANRSPATELQQPPNSHPSRYVAATSTARRQRCQPINAPGLRAQFLTALDNVRAGDRSSRCRLDVSAAAEVAHRGPTPERPHPRLSTRSDSQDRDRHSRRRGLEVSHHFGPSALSDNAADAKLVSASDTTARWCYSGAEVPI